MEENSTTDERLLDPQEYLGDVLAAVDLLKEKVKNASLDPADWLDRTYARSRLESVTFSYKEDRPRALLGNLRQQPDTVLVAFRDSTDADDWLNTNLRAYGDPNIFDRVGSMHAGFYERAKDVPPEPFLEMLRSGKRLVVCGL
uniref:Uncharacterized protein n=1 Tax=Chromera velia CCMP2878 TaxID=1169474 RepID=A0A0G4IC01_9ALVE|eukprot:Cvel_2229.t1-p1 / transcript=Cvel_2229.t1 / gene=Cvel_2229 / organism=Chromera_velia_CCMP2878 / gene_product=hypothetical protein / transcript_product=hypothetical protein / location=Cvel_scaffold86:28879-29391(+) / protein_length=142 / sequence_SO=supercontig / SO=protein_coding / is_pseudo=false